MKRFASRTQSGAKRHIPKGGRLESAQGVGKDPLHREKLCAGYVTQDRIHVDEKERDRTA